MTTNAIAEPLPPGSHLLRVYNDLPRSQCVAPQPYKFATVLCPPIKKICEIKGGHDLKIKKSDFAAMLAEAKKIYPDVLLLMWDHNGKRRYYPFL